VPGRVSVPAILVLVLANALVLYDVMLPHTLPVDALMCCHDCGRLLILARCSAGAFDQWSSTHQAYIMYVFSSLAKSPTSLLKVCTNIVTLW